MIRTKHIIILLIVVFIGNTSTHAQKYRSKFRNSLDNKFDVSYFLKDFHGVLPILPPITEPTVGYGSVGALLSFIPKKPKEIENKHVH
jgi:hypothetical protein